MTYVQWKFGPIRGHPWSLAVGYVHGNLRDLGEQTSPPIEEHAFRMFTGLSAGLGPEAFVDVLHNRHKLSMASIITEQGHNGVSNVVQHHRGRRGMQAAQALGHVCQIAQLVTVGEDEAELARSGLMIDREQRRNPHCVIGRNLYVEELSDEAAAMPLKGRTMPADIHQQIIYKHGERWRAMPQERTDDFDGRVVVARVEAAADNAERLQQLVHRQLVVQARIGKQAKGEGQHEGETK